MNKKFARLSLTALLVLSMALTFAGIAFAFDSGGNPANYPGDNTVQWTGQGASNGQVNTEQCDATNDPNGENQPYLLWVFTTDGGSAQDATLHLGGTGSGDFASDTNQGNNFHFVTPYFTPDSSLTAYVDFTVITTGNGGWNLVISHGCSGTGGGGGGGGVAYAPTVSKDAAGSYDNTYTWTIEKSVDKTTVKQVGGTATFNYEVKVTYDNGTISNVTVAGTITVHNSNAADLTLGTVTDQLSDGTSCSVDTSGGLTAPANGDATFPYTCSLSGLPGSDVTNTATATWSDQTLSGGSQLIAGSANFTTDPISFTANNIDECVDVTDSYAGTLGTVCVGGTNPTTFSYSRTVSVPAYDCVSYDNTATFTTNDTGAIDSASQTVTVCGPAKTGALTMGFWQNKNGQAIISGGASTAGVCNSATWLRQYAPFQDLSATANCKAVAIYVTNVIKAANASGATMNAMLKGQMLATALDVYFSEPALGGNKINAPAPIGGVAIDLTKVCKNIGTCSVYETVSSAFGGASSLTVSQMLAYAASQSNSGGSAWYGQVKTTQELAKDAFDAINNQVAFAP